jgi:hypothetical protein
MDTPPPHPKGPCTSPDCLRQVVQEAASYTDDEVLVWLVATTTCGSAQASAQVGRLLAACPFARPNVSSALLSWVVGHAEEEHPPVISFPGLVAPTSIVAQVQTLRALFPAAAAQSFDTVMDEWELLTELFTTGVSP